MARLRGHAVAVLMLVLLQGCITVEDGDDDGNGGNGGNGNGAPIDNGGDGDNGGDAEAIGSPIDIPAITAVGQSEDVARAEAEGKLRDACGGDVCLEIVFAQTHEDFQTCEYSGETDPSEGTTVEEGDTLTLIMGSQPCTDADGDGAEDDADGDGTPDVLDDDGVPDAEQSPT